MLKYTKVCLNTCWSNSMNHINSRRRRFPKKSSPQHAALDHPASSLFTNQPEVRTACVCCIHQFSAEIDVAVLQEIDSFFVLFGFFWPSQGTFGPVFLGAVSSRWETASGAEEGAGTFVGCVAKLRVNSNDCDLMGEAVRGRNIENCDPPVCQHLPCRNGGTCVR